MITLMWIVSTLVLAFILRVFELPYEQNAEISSVLLRDFGSAIWLSVITMTTVGYGDICPKTTGGRFTAMFIAIWGSFVISLLIMVTADIFEFHPKE
jgi:voltage-gated potassium channel Kch